jgi:uncharacterized membrane protein YbaN (DUF454 family)
LKTAKRFLLTVVGTLSLILGVIGIFVPLLPTVPFILLASYCYAKSSDKFHRWLMNNRWVGKMIREYQAGRGVPLPAKVFSVILLWSVMGYTILTVVESPLMKILLFIVGIAVTVHLMMMKSYRS